MRVTGNDSQMAVTAGRMRHATDKNAGEATTAETSSCRALIPLSPVQSSNSTAPAVRQPAGFLAQLIATQQALPQTRERRRIDPKVGVAIYSRTSTHAMVFTPHALSTAA